MTLAMTAAEEKNIDTEIEKLLDWAKTRQAEAEQLSLDAVRLLSCTGDRLDEVKNLGFFKRCWSRFTGEAAAAERANTGNLIQMQKYSLRYITMLQEQQFVMAHSMLSLKNYLSALAVEEEETRNIIDLLAKRTLKRFEKLEHRVAKIEISSDLQGWLHTLEERDYDEKYPTEHMRLFRVINDFYGLKNDGWNYDDLLFMRKAIRIVGLDPKRQISLNVFIDSLIDEIQREEVGFDSYGRSITLYRPKEIGNYSNFVVENISSPVFTSLHGLKIQYMDRHDVVERLINELKISPSEALKTLLRSDIQNMGVDLDSVFPLAETAIEILGCLRLAEKLAAPQETWPRLEENPPGADLGEEENPKIELSSPKSGPHEPEEQKQTETVEKNRWEAADLEAKKIVKLSRAGQEIYVKINWIDYIPPFRTSEIQAIAAGKAAWLILNGEKYGSRMLFRSVDGHNWTSLEGTIKPGNYKWVKCINETFLLLKDDGKIFFSTDGLAWREAQIPKAQSNISDKEKIDLIFFKGQWVLHLPEERSFSYTEKGKIWDSDKTDSYWAPVFYRSDSLLGPWERWTEASFNPKGMALESFNLFATDKTLFARFRRHYHYDVNNQPIWRSIFCIDHDGPRWNDIAWRENEKTDYKQLDNYDDEIKGLFFWQSKGFCVHYHNGNKILISDNGYTWRLMDNNNIKLPISNNQFFEVNDFLLLASNEGRLYLTADGEHFAEMILPDSGKWEFFATNGQEILARFVRSENECFLRQGLLISEEADDDKSGQASNSPDEDKNGEEPTS